MENKGRCRSHKTRAFSEMKNVFIVSFSKSMKRKDKTKPLTIPGCEYLLRVGGL